jgi:AmiR/NasT family two-component response regulator
VAGARVLVVEDEAIIRMDLVETLRGLGYDVVGEAGDGATAVELARSLAPDVVLMDIAMPRMDGLTAAEELGGIDGPAVVMVTAFSQEQAVQRAADAGAMAYLVKPLNASDLGPAINVAIARQEQMRQLAREASDARQRLADRTLVERAKGRLQSERGLTEDEAFVWMRRAAMNARSTLAKVAEEVLNE